MAAALQAVDGVALKAAVDAWAAAPAAEKPAAFSAAFAVRQIEIGLASLLSILFGATAALYGLLLYGDGRYPPGSAALLWRAASASPPAGSPSPMAVSRATAMNIQMPASLMLLAWITAVAAILWRRERAAAGGVAARFQSLLKPLKNRAARPRFSAARIAMNAPVTTPVTPPYKHTPLFPLGKDSTQYRKLDVGGIRVETVMGREMVVVPAEALRALAEAAYVDINHLLRPGHLASLRGILDDPEATSNDKFVAYDLLKNANISAGGVLPMCQDTGTAIIMGKKGRLIWTEGDDEAALAEGARDAYLKKHLRYSQLAPLSMFEEKNTKSNMPAQIEIYAEGEDAYKFLFVAKGGGSANKSFLFQATPSILTHDRMLAFLKEKILTLGTAACPPYHLAIVIGGTSAELTMKTVKLASCRYLDDLPTQGSEDGNAFRDLEMEKEVHKLTQSLGVGAQFGGKYFCHDVRVIRLPRHGASLPIGLGVSCSADRQALGKITRDGVFLEALEANPAKYLPEVGGRFARRRRGGDRPHQADGGNSRDAEQISGEDTA